MHIYRGVHRVEPRERDDMESIKIGSAHWTVSSTASFNVSLSRIKKYIEL